jgi:hypothetical protein
MEEPDVFEELTGYSAYNLMAHAIENEIKGIRNAVRVDIAEDTVDMGILESKCAHIAALGILLRMLEKMDKEG